MAGKGSRQERLPGTENAIPELEELGHEYAGVRDERMDLTRKEVELKERLLEAMKRNDLSACRYQDIEMEIVPGKEKVKVKVSSVEEPEAGE